MDIKFTIALPAYKEKFLPQCIESILQQTYRNFEIVIVDDCSPNNLFAVVSRYADSRVRFYRNEVGFGAKNVVGNWNKCLEYATGDFVLCMGDDDMLCPNCLQDYYDLICKYPEKDVFHSWTKIVDENGRTSGIQFKRPEEESVYSSAWRLWHGDRQFIGDWLFRTSSLRRMGGFCNLPYAWGSDHLTAYSVGLSEGIANTQRVGFLYRENSLTITRDVKNAREKVEAMIQAKHLYKELFSSEPSEEEDKAYRMSLLARMDTYFSRRIAEDIAGELSVHPFHVFIWLWRIRRLQVSCKTLLLACIYACARSSK